MTLPALDAPEPGTVCPKCCKPLELIGYCGACGWREGRASGRIPRCPKCLRVYTRGDWRKLYPTVDVLWQLCPSCDPAGIRRDERETRRKAREGYGPALAGVDVFKGFREGE